MTSDRSAFDIHSTWMTGVGYYAAVETPLFPGRVLVSAHLGVGFVEVPNVRELGYSFVTTNGITRNVNEAVAKLDHGRPDFNSEWGAVGLSFEVMLPLTKSLYVTSGGRLYANANPNPWTAYIGISKDLGSFRRFLLDDDGK
jgi:hypothetical protein